MRRLLGTLIGASACLCAPILAQNLQTPECNAANIASTAEAISKMQDGKQKSLASDEISAASEALAEGKTDDCKAHILKASLQTK